MEKGLIALSVLVLWQVAGCVAAPPEEVELPNHPPWIDWSLTVPAEDNKEFDLGEYLVEEFSVEQAVEDPDGDPIYIQWYWRRDDEAEPEKLLPMKGPKGFGELTFDFRPCDFSKLLDATRVKVVVAVSDTMLIWDSVTDADNPVRPGADEDGNPRPMVKRVWTLVLKGECPD